MGVDIIGSNDNVKATASGEVATAISIIRQNKDIKVVYYSFLRYRIVDNAHNTYYNAIKLTERRDAMDE